MPKRCPTCYETFADERLRFCRRDGTPLVEETSPLTSASQKTLVKLVSPSSDAGAGLANPHSAAAHVSSTTVLSTGSLKGKRRTTRSKQIDSIAVLPLINASADQHMEYLSDGITESIINSLAQLPKLRVVPRSTVFRYKGSVIDPQEVGNILGTRAVMTGRVLQVGDLLVIKVELIDIALESQLWGEEYRRGTGDVFALQEEISREISSKLRLRLSGQDRRRLARRYTENTEAYHFYLRGRYYTNKRTTDWLNKGIEQFEQAIRLDPKYALAHTGLADAYALLASSTGERAPNEWYPRAIASALKALEFDERVAEAHTSLGFCRLLYDWDFAQARREFKRAIELNPASGNAHDGHSFYLKATGQHAKAIRACLKAQQVDPLSGFATVSLGWAYYFARQYDQAIEQHLKAIELDPHFAFAYWIFGMSLSQQGRAEEAVEAFERAISISGGGLTYKGFLGYACALAGKRGEAERVLSELNELKAERYVSSYYSAIIHLGLGDFDQALTHLEAALEERSGFMAFVNVEPMLDPLRTERRFVALEKRVRANSA